ncbi:MAG: aminopeptidase N [Bdellovibrionales bacterium]
MRTLSRFLGVITIGLLTAFSLRCAHDAKKETKAPGKSQTPSLSAVDAAVRAKQIADVDYELDVDLSQPGDRYSGREVITFNALASGRDLRLDFADGTVTRLALNGKPLEIKANKHFLVIPGVEIKKGPQRLEVDFNQEYSRQGRGLTRFIDPVDKQTYLYTDFEPYDANRFFPCFDQPDLKGTFTLKVLAPKHWEVVTSTLETSVQPEGNGLKRWNFPRSARFSTYIFPLHAGPFAKWEDKGFRIPLRLFARKSLAPYVKVKEWFPITRHGFDFFEKYFGTEYPYKKYDQLMVPEFNAGAMENVAAVTFTERFTSRGTKTRGQQRGLAITILHEMAHMWFGNLVTMRWWGDLWLNESFATYMSSVALAASPEFKEAWHQFFAGKSWAYYEDQMVTTHPIVAKVDNTDDAFTAFDGITYGKGAAVLKQLSYTIGEENFKKGLKIYFDRYAEKNTEYRDFMNAMSEASHRDLDTWKRLWFETSGVNSVAAQFDCRDGRISQFAILQNTASGDSTMRPHAFEIALLTRENGALKVNDTIRLEISEPTTYVTAAIGKTCPAVVYPNLNDHGYIKVRLDDRSVEGLKRSLNEVQSAMLRHQLWYALWDKVRDAELNYISYADLLVPEALDKENDDLILGHLAYNTSSILGYFQQTPSLKGNEFKAFGERLDQLIWKRLKAAQAGSNDQLVWFDGITNLTSSAWGLGQIKRLLKGQEKLFGFKLDQDRRWKLIHTLSRYNDPESLALIESESKRDPSSEGVEQKIASLAARPLWDEKIKWINEYKLPKSTYSFSQLRSAFRGLFPYNQDNLREQFSEQFFQDLKVINQSKDNFVAGLFTRLAPSECSDTSAGKTLAFLDKETNLQPVIRKNLRISAQEGERCRKIVGLAEKGVKQSQTP